MASLYIAYRPRNFDEVIGNEDIINSLTSILNRDMADVPHAILLTGGSGMGKTTIGRIIADILGCPKKTRDGEVNGDFIEINAANNRGIETAREIIATMHYHPAMSKCRVWLIDECAASTRDFQQSMLKILEDSPEHCYFILCTTDPQKLLPTIRNRCSTFAVKSLPDNQTKRLLNNVLSEEETDIPDNVKDEIVEASEGCPRQALVMLDQIIDLPEDQMLESVKGTSVDGKEVRELCQAILKKQSWKKISGVLKGLKKEDPEKIRRAVLGYMSAVMLNDANAGESASQAALIFDCFKEPVFYTGFPGIVAASFNTLD